MRRAQNERVSILSLRQLGNIRNTNRFGNIMADKRVEQFSTPNSPLATWLSKQGYGIPTLNESDTITVWVFDVPREKQYRLYSDVRTYFANKRKAII